jgi:nitrogen fixation protein FixH
MALTTSPAQPVSGEDTTFEVTLNDASGQPVAGAKVEAALEMKIMDMGKNVVTLADKGNGVYQGKGQFTMSGPWDVVVTANKAGASGAQRFEVMARK